MTTSRRLNLFSWLLVVLVALSGTAPLAVWQCRHASRVISAAAPLSVMPCRTSNVPMGGMPDMACCPPEAAPSAISPHSSMITRPACHPALTRLAALPPASVLETHSHLQRILAAAQPALPRTAPFLPSPSAILPLRQRPPPSLGFCQSTLKHAPGLRAPPAA